MIQDFGGGDLLLVPDPDAEPVKLRNASCSCGPRSRIASRRRGRTPRPLFAAVPTQADVAAIGHAVAPEHAAAFRPVPDQPRVATVADHQAAMPRPPEDQRLRDPVRARRQVDRLPVAAVQGGLDGRGIVRLGRRPRPADVACFRTLIQSERSCHASRGMSDTAAWACRGRGANGIAASSKRRTTADRVVFMMVNQRWK